MAFVLVADGLEQRATRADEDANALGTRNCSVEEITPQHQEEGLMKGDDHRGILAALALVDRYSVTQAELIEYREIILGVAIFKLDAHAGTRGVDGDNPADRAVEDKLFVVVAQLDDAVALTKGAVARL